MPPKAPAGAPSTLTLLRDSPLSAVQVLGLNQPIKMERVIPADVKKGTKAHLAAYDIRVNLIKFFGYGGWSFDIIDTTMLYERLYRQEEQKRKNREGEDYIVPAADRIDVGYRVRGRLSLYVWERDAMGMAHRLELATYTEEAAGGASAFPQTKRADAHDFPVKTAASQSLKRCAMNLGDQFGLSLYREGNAGVPIVGNIAVGIPFDEGKAPEQAARELTQDVHKVVAEELAEVPEEERDWVSQAEAMTGDVEALERLYADARAVTNPKLSRATLDAINRIGNAGTPGYNEGEPGDD